MNIIILNEHTDINFYYENGTSSFLPNAGTVPMHYTAWCHIPKDRNSKC